MSLDLATDSEAEEAHKSRFLQLLESALLPQQLDVEESRLLLSDDGGDVDDDVSYTSSFSNPSGSTGFSPTLATERAARNLRSSSSADADKPSEQLSADERRELRKSVTWSTELTELEQSDRHGEKSTSEGNCSAESLGQMQSNCGEERDAEWRLDEGDQSPQPIGNNRKLGDMESVGCGMRVAGQVDDSGCGEPEMDSALEPASLKGSTLFGRSDVPGMAHTEVQHPPPAQEVQKQDSLEGAGGERNTVKGKQSQSISVDMGDMSESVRPLSAAGIGGVEHSVGDEQTALGMAGVVSKGDETAAPRAALYDEDDVSGSSEASLGSKRRVGGRTDGARRGVDSKSQRGPHVTLDAAGPDTHRLDTFSQAARLQDDHSRSLIPGGTSNPLSQNAQLAEKTGILLHDLPNKHEKYEKAEIGGGRSRSGGGGGSSNAHLDAHGRVAAHRIADLMRKVEELRAQVADEKAQRQAATHSLAEQRRDADRNLKRVRETWESKLRDVQKEKYSLSIRVQELEALNPRQKVRRGVISTSEEVHLTREELHQLRQEILEQETLLQGYQKENEKMAERIKELEAEGKERMELMAEENARLAAQVVSVHAMDGQRATDSAATLERVLALESELDRTNQTAHARELDLKFELDKVRQGKRELEARMAGLDPVKMLEEDSQLVEARAELAKEREGHARVVSELERKLAWYAENQDILNNIHSAMETQNATITDLRRQVAAYEGADVSHGERMGEKGRGGGRGSGSGRGGKVGDASARAGARIRALEKQVSALQEALKSASKDPNSLAYLIQMSKPSGEESEVVRVLREQVGRLQEEIGKKDDEAGCALRSLRQEHERIKREYEARLRAAKQHAGTPMGTAHATTAASERPSAARLRQLETNLEEVRTFYQKKVKDLTKKLQDALKESSNKKEARRGHEGDEGVQNSSEAKALGVKLKVKEELARANEKITRLQDILAHKDTLLNGLRHCLDQAKGESARENGEEGNGGRGETLAVDGGDADVHENERQRWEAERQMLVQSLEEAQRRSQNLESTMADIQHQRHLQTQHQHPPPLSATPLHQVREQVGAQQIARDGVAEDACNEAVSHVAASQVFGHGADSHAPVPLLQHTSRPPTTHPHPQLGTTLPTGGYEDTAAAMVERTSLLARIEDLSAQLQQLRLRSTSPEWVELEKKMSEMERKQAEREEQWRSVVAETKRICGMETDMLQSKWELAMEAKNAQIHRFRFELDAIISAAARLHKTHPYGAAGA